MQIGEVPAHPGSPRQRAIKWQSVCEDNGQVGSAASMGDKEDSCEFFLNSTAFCFFMSGH